MASGGRISMFALRVARVLDGRELLPGSGVVFVDGDRIVGVEPAGFPMPEGCEVLDRPAGTLPGLIDGHVHLVADSGVGPLDRLPGFVNDCRYNERTQRKNRELREGRRLSVVTPGGPLRRHRNALDAGGIGRPDPVASLMLSADRGPARAARGATPAPGHGNGRRTGPAGRCPRGGPASAWALVDYSFDSYLNDRLSRTR